ncbi:helix-turn-helix domain-containing protein [Paraburkholderia sp. BL27I4N3]|uniref:helix-turn-helix domain-containing protein n=1 Tax=Paraburkholderia sp. BL27I4N3 TaxID=1938805 RepID=UPI0015F2828A|nr:AraC family transcriptional regulator [Paraburkholderia sp. BL27I4N3]
MELLFPGERKTVDFSGFKIANDLTLDNFFSLMEMEFQSSSPSGRLYAESLSIALVTYLIHAYTPAKPLEIKGRLTGKHLEDVETYIRENLSNELSLAELANLVHTSPFHFARLFKAATGFAPHRYVVEQRITAAQRLLRADLDIAYIAALTGFSSQAHMSYVFRRHLGESPTEVRRRICGKKSA